MTVHLNYDIKMLCNLKALYKYMGISDVAVHYYRYKRHTDKDLICPFYRVVQETDLHFVLCCSVLRTLRPQFIPLKFYKGPCLFRLNLLLASTNETIVRNLTEKQTLRKTDRQTERQTETDTDTDDLFI